MERHFISYPKSGRSWIRYILAQLGRESLIQFHHDGFEFNDGSKPALDFSADARLGRYAGDVRLVYLQRDPRDILVSLFYQVTGRFRDYFGYTGSISDFIRDEYFGASNLQRFREMWQEIAAQRNLLVVSYEGCHADMLGSMCQILAWKIHQVA
jgi:Sulfotransferase domain